MNLGSYILILSLLGGSTLSYGLEPLADKWKTPPIQVTYRNPSLPPDKQIQTLRGHVNILRITHDKVVIKIHVPKPPEPPKAWHPGYWVKRAMAHLRPYSEQTITLKGEEAETAYAVLTEPGLLIPYVGKPITNGASSTLGTTSPGIALTKPASLYLSVSHPNLEETEVASIDDLRLNINTFYPRLPDSGTKGIVSETPFTEPVSLNQIRSDQFIKPINFFNRVGMHHQFGVPRPDGLVVPFYGILMHSSGSMVGIFKTDLDRAEAGEELPLYKFPIETLRLTRDPERQIPKWQLFLEERQGQIAKLKEAVLKRINSGQRIHGGQTYLLRLNDEWERMIQGERDGQPGQARIGSVKLSAAIRKLSDLETVLRALKEDVKTALKGKVGDNLREKSDPAPFGVMLVRCNGMLAEIRTNLGQ